MDQHPTVIAVDQAKTVLEVAVSDTPDDVAETKRRGDSYLRLLLIHGARSVLGHATRARSNDLLRTWAVSLNKRTRYNKASVALANKLARTVRAVWSRDTVYRSEPPVAA